jgi:hypothetical protein
VTEDRVVDVCMGGAIGACLGAVSWFDSLWWGTPLITACAGATLWLCYGERQRAHVDVPR